MPEQTALPSTEPPLGRLPDWGLAELPDPLPFSPGNMFRTIGPGAILLAATIGGGEWLVGPAMSVEHGPGMMWIVGAQ